MQRSLINYRTGKERIAALFQRDGQAVKPVAPTVIKMPLDANFVKSRLGLILR